MNITIDCGLRSERLTHFWASTGFTPASLLLRNDMRQAMTYVGALPNGAVRYVRVHYLLDLVILNALDAEWPRYDFTCLYEALDVLVSKGLKPVFELMGNPSKQFTDFNDDRQLRAWRDLILVLAGRLITRYGREEVETWYFETWNEPDCDHWWHQWPADEQAFCNYYDACSEGLAAAHEPLRLGGPGTCRTLSPMFKAFLAHCDSGTNHFTGDKGVRLDFISVHEKGVAASGEDLQPDSRSICRRETRAFEYVRENHPRFTGLEFMNNECDPQTGWSDPHAWRAGPYYAAIAAKIVAQHCHALVDEQACRYALLSNDNGFLGGWPLRTQLARFGNDEQLAADRFELVKKPVLNVLTLLAMLGERRIEVAGLDDPCGDLGAIASLRGDTQVAVLVYHSSDVIDAKGCTHVSLTLENLPFDAATLVHYRIDPTHCNPHAVWLELGRPDRPSPYQLARMRRHHEPALLEPVGSLACDGRKATLEFDLPLPGVSLLLLTVRPGDGPQPVTGLRAVRYKGLDDHDQTMLSWTALDARTVASYTVLAAANRRGPYQPVSGTGAMSAALLHAPAPPGPMHYKVHAVDYWGRRGPDTELTVPWRHPSYGHGKEAK